MPRLEMYLPVYSTDAMRAADRATIEAFGIPGFTLMEAAARGAVDAIERFEDADDVRRVLVLAGKGNNGGDGLAIARHLASRFYEVLVITLAGADDATPDARRNLELLRAMDDTDRTMLGIAEIAAGDEASADAAEDRAVEWLSRGPCIVVDALLGIGVRTPLRAPIDRLADLCERCDTVVAIDVPTGIDSDTGEQHGPIAVQADLTVTMAGLKPGLLFGHGRDSVGQVEIVDIGIPPHISQEALRAEGCAEILTDTFVRSTQPVRETDAHKGSVGLALVVAGSDGYTGAAVLASMAAGRVGAGYVTCATTPSARAAIDAQSPPTATVALPTTETGGIAASAVEEVVARASRADALLVGPGLGRDEDTVRFVRELLARVELPTVIDADGLYALSAGGLDEFPAEVRARWVLTPHLGEFRRLVESAGGDPETLDLDRRTWLVREWAERLGVTLVLKGAPTVTAVPSGETYVAADVQPAFAAAGSGDVLAGMTVGLAAQGLPPLMAALHAQHIGAAAAEDWVERNAERAMQPTDTVEALPRVLRERFEAEA